MKSDKQRLVSTEPAWSTYIHAKGAALGMPVAGNFELTGRCNFGCKMCYVHNSDGSDELSAEQWIEIGRQAAEKGMVFLLLTGGEPFLRKDFKEIYLALKKLGLLISINTNGSLIDDEMFDFLTENPPLRMNISLYGSSNETYTSLCGKPMFDVVSQNIIRLHEAGISIRVNGSITPYNASDIKKLYQLAEQWNVPLKATTYMFPPVRVNGCKYGEAQHRFSAEEAAKYMLQCKEQYLTPSRLAENNEELFFDDEDCVGSGEHMRCRAGSTAFWITWDGRMLPCGMFPSEGFSVAEYGFWGAWQAVRGFSNSIFLPEKCSRCSHKKNCPACAAACLAETGRTDVVPDYICEMTSTLSKMTGKKYGYAAKNESSIEKSN